MAKSPKQTAPLDQVDLFVALGLDEEVAAPQAPPAPYQPVVQETAVERDGEGALMLRRVQVNPVALSRAASVMAVFAREYGVGREEKFQLRMIVRESDILFVADLDEGFSRSQDGEARPMHLRYSVPLSDAGEGPAVRMGAVIRAMDPVTSLRNSVVNSENFGVLSDAHDITLEVYATADESRPAYFAVHAPHHGVNEPRVFRALRGADISRYAEMEPQAATRGIADLDADSLIEIAESSDPQIGLRIMMGEEGKEGYVVGVGKQGLMLSKFTTPAVAPKDETQDEEEEVRALSGDVIISPRFAFTLGIAQGSFEGAMKSKQKSVTNHHSAHVIAAALSSTLASDPAKMIALLQEEVAQSGVKKAYSATRSQHGDAMKAVAFAKSLLTEIPEEGHARFVRQVESWVQSLDSLSEQSVQAVRQAADSEPAVAQVAMAYVAANGDEARLTPSLNRFLGETKLHLAAASLLRDVKNEEYIREVNLEDIAVAAVRIRGDKSGSLTSALLPELAPEKVGAWWDGFAAYMEQLQVPSEAREAILARRNDSRLPKTSDLAIPSQIRERWISEAKTSVQGRIWAGENGRVYAGFGDPQVGFFMMSDRAVQPQVDQYPVTRTDVEALTAKKLDSTWKTQIWSSDLDFAADRVASLSDPRQDEPALNNLFVARWTPAGHAESPTGKVLNHFERMADKLLITPQSVQVGEGSKAEDFVLERNSSEPIADESEAGTLRIFGIHASGEKLHLQLPMKAQPNSRADKPFAFAINGERVNFLAGYIARKGRYSILEVGEGVVRISDQHLNRVTALPILGATQVPPRLRPIVEAAGVKRDEMRSVSLDAVKERAQQMRKDYQMMLAQRGPRRLEKDVSPVEALERKVERAPEAGRTVAGCFFPAGTPDTQIALWIDARIKEGKAELEVIDMGGVKTEVVDGLLGPEEITHAIPLMTTGGRRQHRTRAIQNKSRAKDRRKEILRRIDEMQTELQKIAQILEGGQVMIAGKVRSGMEGVRLILESSSAEEQDDESRALFGSTDNDAEVLPHHPQQRRQKK